MSEEAPCMTTLLPMHEVIARWMRYERLERTTAMSLMPSPETQEESRYWKERIAQIEDERDALERCVATMAVEKDEIAAALEMARKVSERLATTVIETEAERDRAIRQRDHARTIAERYAAIWGTTDMYEPVEPVPADDGWQP